MDISQSVALVTGANRGIGRKFAELLVERGASRVYATTRRPETIDMPGVEVLPLDITDPASVAAAARVASDVDLVINNAGVATYSNLISGDMADIRTEMDTHFYGTLAVARAFAPILAANGGGAIVNMLSVLSWLAYDGANAYAAAKAAEWSLTHGIRLELARQGTHVTGVHFASADTDMTASYDGDKLDPMDVAHAALDGVQNGKLEVIVDDFSTRVKTALASDPGALYADTLHATAR